MEWGMRRKLPVVGMVMYIWSTICQPCGHWGAAQWCCNSADQSGTVGIYIWRINSVGKRSSPWPCKLGRSRNEIKWKLFSLCAIYVVKNVFNELTVSVSAKDWVSCLQSLDVERAWRLAMKTAFNSSLCAVTAHSKWRLRTAGNCSFQPCQPFPFAPKIGSAEEPPGPPPECCPVAADFFRRGFVLDPRGRETVRELLHHQVFVPGQFRHMWHDMSVFKFM